MAAATHHGATGAEAPRFALGLMARLNLRPTKLRQPPRRNEFVDAKSGRRGPRGLPG